MRSPGRVGFFLLGAVALAACSDGATDDADGPGGGGVGGAPGIAPRCSSTPRPFYTSADLGVGLAVGLDAAYVTLAPSAGEDVVMRLPFSSEAPARTDRPEASIPGYIQLRAIAIDADGTPFGTGYNAVVRLPFPPERPTSVAGYFPEVPPQEGQDTLDPILVVGDSIYTGSRKTIARVPKTGGELATIATGLDHVRVLAATATRLGFADELGVGVLPLDGTGDVERLDDEPSTTLSLDGDRWFFGSRRIRSTTDGSDTVEVVPEITPAYVRALTTGDGNVFYVQEDTSGMRSVRVVPTTGGDVRELDTTDAEGDAPLAYTQGCLFYRFGSELRVVRP